MEEFKMAAISWSSEIQFLKRGRKIPLQINLAQLCEPECECPRLGLKIIAYVKDHINAICQEEYRDEEVRSRA